MPTAILATVGDAAANSYITVAEGDAYAADVLPTPAWTTATADNKIRALLAATARLDELEWIGGRTDTTTPQALAWPREGAACGEKDYDDDVVPIEVKRGTFELANLLLKDVTVDPFSTVAQVTGELVPGIANQALKAVSLGNGALSLDFKDASGAPSVRNALNVLPSLVTLFGCLCLTAPFSAVRRITLSRA
jgi:hypothetical protein